MSPDEFLIANENRQRQREINGDQPEYVNFNNAATKFLLDQVIHFGQVFWTRTLNNYFTRKKIFCKTSNDKYLFLETQEEVFFEKYENRIRF